MTNNPETHRAIAAAELDGRCDLLARAPVEVAFAELQTQASRLGRFVVAGLLERNVVVAGLTEACRRNGSVGAADEHLNALIDHMHAAIDEAAAYPMTEGELENLATEGSFALAIKIDDLARLSPIDYDRVRKDEARKMGVRPGVLDTVVEERRLARHLDDEGADIPTHQPYPNEVDGAELLDEIVTSVRRFMVMSEAEAAAAALYVLYSHVFDRFHIAPRLLIKSEQKRSGKTRLCTLLSYMVQRACPTSNTTPAALYRVVHKFGASLIIDEADTFATVNNHLRGILNCGHTRRMAFVLRATPRGNSVDRFNIFAPMVIALIGAMPDTIEDRSIIITMKRKVPVQVVEEWHDEEQGQELAILGAKAARWAADNGRALTTRGIVRPEPVRKALAENDRAWDNWAPLFALAERAGGRWPTYVVSVISELAQPIAVGLDEETKELLRNIANVFVAAGVEAMRASDLHAALASLRGGRWSNLSAKRLGSKLAALQIARGIKRDGTFYARAAFAKHWEALGIP